ncbi:MAG TPA: hypothetical protein VEL74_24765 [Thermoanaerobaculia bacterium]|nr:hypothetical protein [Thermoanaerobaculia bacterium]
MPGDRRRLSTLRSAVALPLLSALLLAASGCATTRQPRSLEELWKEYEQAVEAAKYPAPGRVSRSLIAITTFTPGLVWDESGQKVLMATWTKAKYYTGQPPYETTVPAPVWLTAVPFLQGFCQRSGLQGESLRVRLAERLGMPPDSANDVFVQMWVDPQDFFRPCPDPEVNDSQCQVNLTTGPVDRSADCPWSAALAGQVSGNFVSVTQSQIEWMCRNWEKSYPAGEPRKSYPWTALGYTYDWGAKSFYGESEFVLPPDSTVTVQSITPMDAYCARAGSRAR